MFKKGELRVVVASFRGVPSFHRLFSEGTPELLLGEKVPADKILYKARRKNNETFPKYPGGLYDRAEKEQSRKNMEDFCTRLESAVREGKVCGEMLWRLLPSVYPMPYVLPDLRHSEQNIRRTLRLLQETRFVCVIGSQETAAELRQRIEEQFALLAL